jgi:hypothetical protein
MTTNLVFRQPNQQSITARLAAIWVLCHEPIQSTAALNCTGDDGGLRLQVADRKTPAYPAAFDSSGRGPAFKGSTKA